ncbi:hypothetical protein GCM10023157_33670 [Gluconacetobacter asukensis]
MGRHDRQRNAGQGSQQRGSAWQSSGHSRSFFVGSFRLCIPSGYGSVKQEIGFAANPHIALTELLHTLVRDLYWQVSGADCLEAYVREIPLRVHSPDMPGSVGRP